MGGVCTIPQAHHTCHFPRALPAIRPQRLASCHQPAKALPRQRLQRKVISQASSGSSQASVTLRAPVGVQQSAPQQKDITIPRAILISIDYTQDADQALQWALDFVVKPGECNKLKHATSEQRNPECGPFLLTLPACHNLACCRGQGVLDSCHLQSTSKQPRR